MTDQRLQTGSPARAAFVGLSALLVIGVVLGTSLKAVDPVVRESIRESDHRAQTPARQFTASLAKAVRELVGGDHHKPAFVDRGPVQIAQGKPGLPAPGHFVDVVRPRHTVRVESLDLPPPATVA